MLVRRVTGTPAFDRWLDFRRDMYLHAGLIEQDHLVEGQYQDEFESRSSHVLVMNLTDADRIWFEQQKQTVLDNEDARVVALNNDFDQFRIMLARLAEEMIVDRHQANGMLFDAYFEKPGFREQLLEYLGDAYHEIRQAQAD